MLAHIFAFGWHGRGFGGAALVLFVVALALAVVIAMCASRPESK
jgi:hypothetical protein